MTTPKPTPKKPRDATPVDAGLSREAAVAAMLADLPGLDPLPEAPDATTLRLRLPADPAPDLFAAVRAAMAEHGLCATDLRRFQCVARDVLVLHDLCLAPPEASRR